MSDTPETDDADLQTFHIYATHYRLMLKHAKRLERERNEARAIAKRYKDTYEYNFIPKLPWEKE